MSSLHKFVQTTFPTLKWIPALVLLLGTMHLLSYRHIPLYPTQYEAPIVDDRGSNSLYLQNSAYLNISDQEKPSHVQKYLINSTVWSDKLRNPKNSFLCSLNIDGHCQMQQVAEVIEGLWVVCPIYASYQSLIMFRYNLHENYKYYIQSFGISFSTIEAIRFDRDQKYLLTKPGNEPYDIQVQFYDDIYIRENLLNVAMKKIPKWDYVAWIDTHQTFENLYWWEQSIVKMEKIASVQLFQYFIGRNPTNMTEFRAPSALQNAVFQTTLDAGPTFFFGNAWGVTQDYYNQVGYIYDECIASCCDCAWVAGSINPAMNFHSLSTFSTYTNQFMPWINHTQQVFKASSDRVRGDIHHLYHEHVFDYNQILVEFNKSEFDVKKDLSKDVNGTLIFTNKRLKNLIEKKYYWDNLSFYYDDYKLHFLYVLIFVGTSLLVLLLKLYLYFKERN